MARTYTEIQALVRDWSNRDPEALPDTIIQDGLRWAADKCYRYLRVPSLEFTRTFTIETTDITQNANSTGLPEIIMPVPQDLIEVVYIRNMRDDQVLEEKLDNRTYYQIYANRTTASYWSRIGNNFSLTGFFQLGDVLEIHYYRRLPALNAMYIPTAATFNIDSSVLINPVLATDQTTVSQDGVLWFPMGTTVDNVYSAMAVDNRTDDNPIGIMFTGMEVEHWLRDENERILTFGALAECFAYLQEDDQAQKYLQLFRQEIDELNSEEGMRVASGGNIKTNYNSILI